MSVRGETDLALPALDIMLVSLVAVIVGLPLIYILSRALKLRPAPIAIAGSKREFVLASIVTVALFLVVFGWRTLTHAFQLFDERSPFVIGPSDILWRAFLDGMCFVVILIAMKSTGQKLGNIGISRSNIGRMFTLGILTSAIYLTLTGLLAPSLGGRLASLSPELAYGFILFTLVGFSEEILWRGYIQTRLAAHIGNIKGFVTTSLLFTVLWHFPGQFYLQPGAILDAFANTFTVLAPSLLFGYLMLRSQNVLPSSIFHLFWDWNSASLWQIPV